MPPSLQHPHPQNWRLGGRYMRELLRHGSAPPPTVTEVSPREVKSQGLETRGETLDEAKGDQCRSGSQKQGSPRADPLPGCPGAQERTRSQSFLELLLPALPLTASPFLLPFSFPLPPRGRGFLAPPEGPGRGFQSDPESLSGNSITQITGGHAGKWATGPVF